MAIALGLCRPERRKLMAVARLEANPSVVNQFENVVHVPQKGTAIAKNAANAGRTAVAAAATAAVSVGATTDFQFHQHCHSLSHGQPFPCTNSP